MALSTCGALVVLAATLTLTAAQVPALGPCPEMKTMANFNMAKYLGRWFEAERYFALFEFAGKCVVSNYTDMGDGNYAIVNRQTSALTGISSTIEGEMQALGRMDETQLTVRFPSVPVSMDIPYWVLDTDYDNYAVIWSCSNFGLFSTRNAWILTRSPTPSLDVMQRAYSVVDRHGVSRAYFIRTDQRNCPSSKTY